MKSESPSWVDFRETKRAVSVEMVLAHYNVQLRRVNRESLRGSCPLPTHSAKGEQSFSVNVTKNIWSCMSSSCVKARQGKRGGNVLDFTALMENSSIRDAALKLSNWFGVSAERQTAAGTKTIVHREVSAQGGTEKKGEGEVTDTGTVEGGENKPLGFALKGIDHSHPYLTARGITPDVALHFGLGYFSGKGSMRNRIVIPIHNRAGELVAYAGRAIDNSEPKYKFPSGFHKSQELWNLHRVLALTPKPNRVIVVEGFFDAMTVHEAGHPNVIALMGCTMSREQEQLLAFLFKGVVLMLDRDEAGKRATDEIALRLARRVFMRIASIPDGRQPDELSKEELESTIS